MNSMVVNRQWASRADDERFLSVSDLGEAVLKRRNFSIEHLSKNKRFRAVADDGDLRIKTELGDFEPTNWSFSQLVNMSQKSVNWLRPSGLAKVHPEMAAQALNYGLNFLTEDADNKILVDHDNGLLRAITGPTYGRIWDHQIVKAVESSNKDGRWEVPVATDGSHSKRSTTLYASDRDVFMFLVDPNNPIEIYNPVSGRMEVKYRGFYTWNSEVGKTTFGLATFLYDCVCDNRIIWGMADFKEIRVRHSQNAPYVFEDIGYRMLEDYANSSAGKVKDQLSKAMELTVANSEKDATEWLRRNAFGASEASSVIEMAKNESGEYRTLWSLVSGATAHARSITHQDTRVHMERRAGNLMKKAA